MLWTILAFAWVLYIWVGAYTLGVAVRVWQEKYGRIPPYSVMFICSFGWPFVHYLGWRK